MDQQRPRPYTTRDAHLDMVSKHQIMWQRQVNNSFRLSLSFYWWGNAFNSSQWSNGSSLISVGLNWWQALLACMVANVISSSVALALGRLGARYHCGYPVLARSVFGMYGHFFFVWVRAVVAVIWFGVQTYFGSQLFSVVLRCIFGSSWWDMANHLPESAGITSRDLLAFFLFWMLELPFQAVHPTKINFLFAVCGFLRQSFFLHHELKTNASAGRVHYMSSCVHRCIWMVCQLWWRHPCDCTIERTFTWRSVGLGHVEWYEQLPWCDLRSSSQC